MSETVVVAKCIGCGEEKEFRQWARENYKVLEDISGHWHPVVQDECRKMNEEALLEAPFGV